MVQIRHYVFVIRVGSCCYESSFSITNTYLEDLVIAEVVDIVSTFFLCTHEFCEDLNIIALIHDCADQVLLLGLDCFVVSLRHIQDTNFLLLYLYLFITFLSCPLANIYIYLQTR